MQIYLAPLQGLTDWIFRESFTEHLGQFDKTFTPFVRMQHGEFYRPSQCNDLLPTNNTFQQPVPQFLGNDAESFKRFEELCLEHDYKEANINMGCPYPMVSGKKMGAGLLSEPKMIAELLKNIFTNTQLKISVKCRLGLESATEFEQIIPILNTFPLEEIILHPRKAKQQYKGEADRTAFAKYAPLLKHSVCYNGDILNSTDLEELVSLYPALNKIMIGRGILEKPFLMSEIRGEKLEKEEKIKRLRSFHSSLIEHCKKKYSGDLHFLKRMEELWEYHCVGFENGRKIYKQVKKSKTLAQYEIAVFQGINDLL